MDGLLHAAKKGDSEAFLQLITSNKSQLYRVALAYLKDEQEALEAIQEVTFRSYKKIKKVREPKYFATWLTRIMINYCADELKRKKRFSPADYDVKAKTIVEENDSRITMEAAIQVLEPKLQEIIILKYFQDMTIEQIATSLEQPTGTIKTWLNKALRRLRKELAKEGGFYV
ncbi:sigma-70 family RNA polymerase sigma factor [Virgibacillus sp. DJP39]|uniref:sigma-70 family RNA polymerase sigma factor n=1 Tax=Virgibacillus sp. DJP39 TaxID=3409790 RepID=UPI003BB76FE2